MLKSRKIIIAMVQRFMVGVLVVALLYLYAVIVLNNQTVFDFTANNLWSIPVVLSICFLLGYYINVDEDHYQYGLIEIDSDFGYEYPDW
ncbi:MAG: hypothetical protein ACKUBY_04275 [Candidatus Moraniibacteriota bacterium]|jgi:hypothetical protein